MRISTLLLFLYPTNESILVETPSLIRRVLFHFVVLYDVHSACHSTALSFLGKKDKHDLKLCSEEEKSKQLGVLLYHILKPEFPIEAESVKLLMSTYKVSLKRNNDETTSIGWAYIHALKLRAFFDNDGWNGLGQPPYYNRFADTTNYKPVNHAQLDEDQLRFPLRWQPLTQHADGRGRYISQIHTFPHIGNTVLPLALTNTQFKRRTISPPYKYKNAFKSISKYDRKQVHVDVQNTLFYAQTSTFRKRQLSIWWDNKLASLAIFLSFYANAMNLTIHDYSAMGLADTIAQHDALLIAWREKRRHDLVRPQTLIRHVLKNQYASVYIPRLGKMTNISLKHFEVIFPSQPHSEYPSASALMCTASLESVQNYLDSRFSKWEIPAFEMNIGKSFRNVKGLLPTVYVKFNRLNDAAKQCGISRLWSGAHFKPAVEAGFKLGVGIGKIAHDHVSHLVAGIVPPNCRRRKM